MKAKESQPQINSRRILWLSFPGSAFSLAGNFFTTDTAGVFLLLYYSVIMAFRHIYPEVSFCRH